MREKVLTFEEALAEVLAHCRAVERSDRVETVALKEAAGRVLAANVVADRDQPPFDRSTRDGYALRAEDVSGTLSVVGTVRAGQRWDGRTLAAGESVEIMTGAALPAGANAVVMVEHVTADDRMLRVEDGRQLYAGENVVPRGAEAKEGDVVLPVGRGLAAAEIAVAASCGVGRVEVFRKSSVAIVATGDELVELDATMDGWQIRNSNSYALEALVHAAGGVAQRTEIARDTVECLRVRIDAGRNANLLLLTGGVSMGKYDLVEHVLSELGAEFFFTGALIQPGKPIVFGRLPRVGDAGQWTYFFGLPGNPVSTQVCFHLFVAPMVWALGGRSALGPQFVEARLTDAVRGGARVTRFLPAALTGAWDGVSVRVIGWQGSGDVAGNARGNCYVVLPANVAAFAAGETVRVLLR
ncbi:MAG: molybdopterin molybdotransferase MoeA [Acidobacteria bacterium]|nr:molybdopterin molybdotransferase MoeA [Acidobacteriota bacterium]